MKKILVSVLIVLLGIALSYVSIAFVLNDWNTSIWEDGQRFLLIFISLVSIMIGHLVYYGLIYNLKE